MLSFQSQKAGGQSEIKSLREKEFRAFIDLGLPSKKVVGRMFISRAKVDIEARIFLAPMVASYPTSPDERKAHVNDALKQLFKRFPDLSLKDPERVKAMKEVMLSKAKVKALNRKYISVSQSCLI